MHIDKFKQTNPSGSFYIYKDEWHQDAESVLQSGILGLCPCGSPQDLLTYVRDGLKLIQKRGEILHMGGAQ